MTPYESFFLIKNELSNLGSIFIVATIYIYIYLSINLYGYIYICVYIIYIYMYIYKTMCPTVITTMALWQLMYLGI